jgi:hypothetical protein
MIAAVLTLAGCGKAPESDVKAPEPETRHLAPDGVLYITRMVSVTTNDGIKGIAPGTKVTVIEQAPGGYKVTDGTSDFSVAEEQVTNDLDLAGALQRHDVQARQQQAALKMSKSKSNSYAALVAEEKQLVSQIAEARAAQAQENSAVRDRPSYTTTLLIPRIPAMEERLQEVRELKAKARVK